MKYNFVMSRTYVTEMTIVADDEASAWDWINDNAEVIYEAELEQMNVINEESSLVPKTPSPNEQDELETLAHDIIRKLKEYSHVEDFIPSEMHTALAKMVAPSVETHNVSTNYMGFTTGAYKYVDELNQLIGRKAFSCRTTSVDPNPYTTWIIFGNDITDDEIDRLNLRQDFIID